MKLGYGTYGMPKLSVVEAVSAVARIGYDGVELAAIPNHPAHPDHLDRAARAEVRARLDAEGLELPALMLALDSVAADQAPQREALRAAIGLAQDLSFDSPPVLVTTLGGSPVRWDDDRQRVAESVAAWAAIAGEQGQVLALEPHVGGVVHRAEQAEWVRQQVDSPAVKFNYDESHFVLRSIPTAESCAIMAPHAVATHVKDALGDAEHVKFLLPGDAGNFDYPEFFRLLHQHGYDGYITVEVSGMVWGAEGYDALAAAGRCYEFLSGALAHSGLHRD